MTDRTTRPHRLQVRLTEAELAELVAVAERDGLSVSSWLRMTGLREARSRPSFTIL